MIEREREKERERERGKKSNISLTISRGKKSNISLTISRGFVGQNSAGRELKLLYTMRATRGYWNHKILLRSKIRVFT